MGNLIRDLPVLAEGNCEDPLEGEAVAGALRVARVGGDERGGHEPLHEVDLLGTGEAGPSGQSQRNRVAGDGPC